MREKPLIYMNIIDILTDIAACLLILTSGLLILSRSVWLGVPTNDNTRVSWSISVVTVREQLLREQLKSTGFQQLLK